jgi:hypothetical protein
MTKFLSAKKKMRLGGGKVPSGVLDATGSREDGEAVCHSLFPSSRTVFYGDSWANQFIDLKVRVAVPTSEREIVREN